VRADRAVVEDDGGRWVLVVEDEEGGRHRFLMDATTTEVLEESLSGFRSWQAERDDAYALYRATRDP